MSRESGPTALVAFRIAGLRDTRRWLIGLLLSEAWLFAAVYGFLQAMVPQGRYRSAWFAQDGPHRLSLFTCSGLTSGRFTSTAFIHAVEVANGDS